MRPTQWYLMGDHKGLNFWTARLLHPLGWMKCRSSGTWHLGIWIPQQACPVKCEVCCLVAFFWVSRYPKNVVTKLQRVAYKWSVLQLQPLPLKVHNVKPFLKRTFPTSSHGQSVKLISHYFLLGTVYTTGSMEVLYVGITTATVMLSYWNFQLYTSYTYKRRHKTKHIRHSSTPCNQNVEMHAHIYIWGVLNK